MEPMKTTTTNFAEAHPPPPHNQPSFSPTATPPTSLGMGPPFPPPHGSGSIPPQEPPSSQNLSSPSYSSHLPYNVAPPGIPVNTSAEDPKKPSTVLEKTMTGIVVSLSSVAIIALVYTVRSKPYFLESRPVGPLVGAAILLLLNLMVAMWLCTDISAERAVRGLLPIAFAVLGCIPFIIYFAVWVSREGGRFVNLNFPATSTSAAVFSGMALGNVIGYLVFDRD